MNYKESAIYGTTILCLKKNGKTLIACDGQVTLEHTVIKTQANKIRILDNGNVCAGFTGSTADGVVLLEKLEEKLEKHPKQLLRACMELAKDWVAKKELFMLNPMLIAANHTNILVLTRNGEIIEPDDSIAAIGSGANYALAAAKALIQIENLSAQDIIKMSMKIAADMCIYTNHNFTILNIGNK